MTKPESYPFLRIAKQYNVPYADVLAYADGIRRGRWGPHAEALQSNHREAAKDARIATFEQLKVANGAIDWRTGESIRDLVFANLNASLENGYFEEGQQLHGSNAEDIALDMIAYAEDCNGHLPRTLIPYINEWLGLCIDEDCPQHGTPHVCLTGYSDIAARNVQPPLASIPLTYYAEDGTLMNADGTRSVFDDVDK